MLGINRSLLRSMPFKLALAFTALYLVCFSVGSFIYYKNFQDSMFTHINRSLETRQNTALQLFDEAGIDAVTQMVETRSKNPMASSFGYHLATLKGERIAGNVPSCTTETGWLDVTAEELGIQSDETYRFLTTQFGDYILSTGRSFRELEEMRKFSLTSLLLTFIVSTGLALIGGSILASRSHSRVRSIVSSMDSVANGNLNARLPVSRRCDDIDSLSSNMNDALGLLQSQIDGMKQVSANIAHDLKTPLTRLYNNLEQANTAASSGMDATVQSKLDNAMEEASNINDTFEALLRIAQIEARSRKAQFVEMDLLPTIQTAVEVYEPVVEEHGQTISLQLHKSVKENGELQLFGDRDLLLQMIVNIIENAIRHCHAGADIVVNAGASDGLVWMSVCDNGPGIPEDAREKVFQRLFRLEASRTTKGSGLGLSLVKAVADLHCGSVSLDDNNPGLCVKVTFNPDCPVEV